jgi:peptide/nickel transport system permease protein
VTAYIPRRLLALIPVLLLVSLTVFALVRVSQGDPSLLLVGQEGGAEVAARIREELGFDRPIPIQYLDWLSHVARGDMGRSMRLPYQVNQLILEKLPITLELALLATLLSVAMAIPLGLYAAVHSGRGGETVVAALTAVGVSMPNFWLGILLIFALAVNLRWLPSSGFAPPQQDALEHFRLLLLPVFTLALANAAIFARVFHNSMVETLWQDYIRTARAKGLGQSAVLIRHGLRNALLPLITAVGVHFGRLLGGAVVVETIFGIPGLGRLTVEAITGRDFTVVQAMVLYMTGVTVISSLIVDVAYAYLDPRVRYG